MPGRTDRRHPRYGVIVVAEGAKPAGGHEMTLDTGVDEFGHARLGGIGHWLATNIRHRAHCEARSVLLGHPQRGGSPGPIDRAMGYLFGCAAVEAIERGEFGTMVSARGIAPACELRLAPLAVAPSGGGACGSATTSVLSGRMKKERKAPKASSTIEPTKGSVQLPVLSMISPKASGETIAASAEPLFIKPLAVPE